MSQQLPLFFSYQAPGRIWQIKTDAFNRCLALEVRDALQEAKFSYVCPEQDRVIFENFTLPESLLSNLVACQKGILLFQQTEDLDNLAEATTIALEAQNGEVLWQANYYRHAFFVGDESFGKTTSTDEEPNWWAIKLREGSMREVSDAEMRQVLHQQAEEKVENHTLLLPASYWEGEQHFATVKDFLQLYLQVQLVKCCEYLHVFDKMVISFYTAEGEKLTNHLAVFDVNGNVLLHQVMADALHQPGSETFMIWQKSLFFIENSSCLKGYNLQ